MPLGFSFFSWSVDQFFTCPIGWFGDENFGYCHSKESLLYNLL